MYCCSGYAYKEHHLVFKITYYDQTLKHVCVPEVTAVTVGDVHTTDDTVFTSSVATAASIPEHVLVRKRFI